MRTYRKNLKLVVLFSIFALLTLSLLPFVSSYIQMGSGFVRFSSLYQDITPTQFIWLLIIWIISCLFTAFFLTTIIGIVKFRETMDVVKVTKIFDHFYVYSLNIFLFLILFSGISILIGVFFDMLNLLWLGHLLIFGLWLGFFFTPQSIVLEDMPFWDALHDSLNFVIQKPWVLLKYLATTLFLVLIVMFVEYGFGLLLFYPWDKVISTLLTAFFVLPFLQIYAAHLYLGRYPVIGA